jgi:hypothetical protein
MELAEIIRALKTDIHASAWAVGHISRSAFPLSLARSKNYKFGPEYHWRVITFDCLSRTFRLLVVINEAKQIFRATLGVEVENDLAVICQHEFHASEPGWHCHLSLAPVETLPPGVTRTHLRRWPKSGTEHSKQHFDVTEKSATSVAAARFRVASIGTLL